VISTFMALPSSSVLGLTMAVVCRRDTEDVKFRFAEACALEFAGLLVQSWHIDIDGALGSKKSRTGSGVL